MAKKFDGDIARPVDPRKVIDLGGVPLVTLKELRKSARQPQEDLAVALEVGQDAISRLEKRSDMLLSSLRHYVESVGGQLSLVVTFPERAPEIIDLSGRKKKSDKRRNP